MTFAKSFAVRSAVVISALFAMFSGVQAAQAQPAVAAPADDVSAQVICGLHDEFWGWYWGNCTNQPIIIRWHLYNNPWSYKCTAPHSDTWLGDPGTPTVEVLQGPCIP
ncbi:hypothetical protein ACRAKJ_10110 [Saccharothrix sp. DSM 118769]